jgi:branched-subunit amino acid ABC-type transport system permease component
MSPAIVVEQLLNAAALSALLFLVSVGLSLVFGILRVVNFAHGMFYMLGAYLGFTLAARSGSFWPALVLAPPLVGLLGAALEASTLRFIYRRPPIYQVLLTFGLSLILEECVRIVWGTTAQSVDPPAWLAGSVTLVGTVYPTYRLFLIALGVLVAAALWRFLRPSRRTPRWRAASAPTCAASAPPCSASPARWPASAVWWRRRCSLPTWAWGSGSSSTPSWSSSSAGSARSAAR